jgi:hypothetical protein
MGKPTVTIEQQSAVKTGERGFIKAYDPDKSTVWQSITNAPSSARQLASDIITPLMHPIKTAKDIYSLGSSVVNLIRPEEQGNEDIARAVGQFFKDRYGSLENIKKTFATDPVGMLADVSIILTGGTTLPAKASGTIGQASRVVGTAGKMIDPVTQAVNIAKIPTYAAAPLIQKFGGVSADALKTAYAAGQTGSKTDKAFAQGMRKKIDMKTVADDANVAFDKMQKKKKKDFVDQKTKLQLDKVKMNIDDVIKGIDDFKSQHTLNNVLDLSDEAVAMLNDIEKIVGEFYANKSLHNAAGVDWLKRRISNKYPLSPKNKDTQTVASTMQKLVKEQIVKQVPDYAKVMEAFETASLLEKQLIQELSLGKTKNASTTLKKLQSIMRDNANTNYGSRLQAFNKLDEFDEANILEKIAGMELSSWRGRGIQGAVVPSFAGGMALGGNLMALGAVPFASPRFTGEAARMFGKTGKYATPTLKTTRAYGLLEPTIDKAQQNRGLLQ